MHVSNKWHSLYREELKCCSNNSNMHFYLCIMQKYDFSVTRWSDILSVLLHLPSCYYIHINVCTTSWVFFSHLHMDPFFNGVRYSFMIGVSFLCTSYFLHYIYPCDDIPHVRMKFIVGSLMYYKYIWYSPA
jgi:hypothetical protein